MSKNNWLYDENGEVRRELYMQTKQELDEKQISLEWPKSRIRKIFGKDSIPPELDALESGDVIFIKPEYRVASKFNGRMTFIALDGMSGSGPSMFCRTEDGGGGFISPEMLVDRNNPTLRK